MSPIRVSESVAEYFNLPKDFGDGGSIRANIGTLLLSEQGGRLCFAGNHRDDIRRLRILVEADPQYWDRVHSSIGRFGKVNHEIPTPKEWSDGKNELKQRMAGLEAQTDFVRRTKRTDTSSEPHKRDFV